MKQFWLMKSEPDAFSFDDLQAKGKQGEPWDGVRNYQARNHMQNMKKNDLVLFYHSSTKPAGVVGIAKVIKESYPDFTALEPESKYFDPKSDPENPRWFMVDIVFQKHIKRLVTLKEIKANPALSEMQLVTHSRLSINQVTEQQWDEIIKMSELS
ncbi:EVE domain-containing protein [Marinicellulosiphila megalodicopiae]|uniref:EVE domain-containing protein n=1 Tax=Marinicellulosiphila megalodicopiae TaxID=2724896 RepID=UPI003BAF1596